MTLTVVAFLVGGRLVVLLALLLTGRTQRIDARMQNLSGDNRANPPTTKVADFARSALPKIATPLLPEDKQERSRLKNRLIHAGLYNRHAMGIFLGVKMLLMV